MHRLLSPESVRELYKNRLPASQNLTDCSFENTFSESTGEGVGFGLAVSVLTDPPVAKGGVLSGIGEFGWGGVASTFFSVDPSKDMGFVFMTQLIPSSATPFRPHLRWLSHKAVEEFREKLSEQRE